MYSIVSPEEARHEPYPYVYVEQDGAVRELTAAERAYLEEPFHPADSGRPYVKWRWGQRDGWGSPSGFVARAHVPEGTPVAPAP